jgi:hypothetical protein
VSIAVESIRQVLDRVQRDLALTSDELAAVLGLSPAQLEDVRTNSAHLPPAAGQRLEQLVALDERLLDSFQPDSVVVWIRSGLRYLHGETPLAVLSDGRFDRVAIALDALDAGIFL